MLAQLGFKVACVEEWKTDTGEGALGGTCLNVGCIPSKALLESSENYERVNHDFSDHGITVSGAKIDIGKMQTRKEKIVKLRKRLAAATAETDRKRIELKLHRQGLVSPGTPLIKSA